MLRVSQHAFAAIPATQQIISHQHALRACTLCPEMIGPVVTGNPVVSPVLLLGQAPGAKEGAAGKPFAWTAGKTLFSWFSRIGLDENAFRERVYMAAVCRCFPGKAPKGGDRVPHPSEIENCSAWLERELIILRPRLLLPVGKLAIARLIPVSRLDQVVGRRFEVVRNGAAIDVVPLPHPSGASPWHRMEPGRSLLCRALATIAAHPAWDQVCTGRDGCRTA